MADRFHDPSYGDFRFERAITVSEIGLHELSIIVVTENAEGYYWPDEEVAFEIR